MLEYETNPDVISAILHDYYIYIFVSNETTTCNLNIYHMDRPTKLLVSLKVIDVDNAKILVPLIVDDLILLENKRKLLDYEIEKLNVEFTENINSIYKHHLIEN